MCSQNKMELKYSYRLEEVRVYCFFEYNGYECVTILRTSIEGK